MKMRNVIYRLISIVSLSAILIGCSNRNVYPELSSSTVDAKTGKFSTVCSIKCVDELNNLPFKNPSPPNSKNNKIALSHVNSVKSQMSKYFPSLSMISIKACDATSPPQGYTLSSRIKNGKNETAVAQAFADVSVAMYGKYNDRCIPVIKRSNKRISSGMVILGPVIVNGLNQPKNSESELYARSGIAHELAHLEFRAKYPFVENTDLSEGFAIHYQFLYLKRFVGEAKANQIFTNRLPNDYKLNYNNFKNKYLSSGNINTHAIEEEERVAEQKFLFKNESKIKPPCSKGDNTFAAIGELVATGASVLTTLEAFKLNYKKNENNKPIKEPVQQGKQYCKCGKPLGHLSNCNPM